MIAPKHIDYDMPIQNSSRIQCSFWSCARRIHSAENLDCLHHHLRSEMARRTFRISTSLRSELHEFLAIWTTGIKQKLQTWVTGTNWFYHDLSWSVTSSDLTSSCCVSWKVSTIFNQVYFHKVKPIEANPRWEPVASSSCKLSCVPVNCVSIIAPKNRSTLRGLKPTQKHEHVGFIMPCEEKDDWIWGSATHKQFEGGFSVVLSITHSNLPVCIWKAITHLSQTQNVSGIKTSELQISSWFWLSKGIYIYIYFQISIIKTLVGFIKSHMCNFFSGNPLHPKWVEPCPACKHRSQGLRPSSCADQPINRSWTAQCQWNVQKHHV